MPGIRMAMVWCPDWPVVAWGVPRDEPAAVFTANRVVSCSAAARNQGVRQGQTRRDAQGRCPTLAVLARDEGREARLFEPVVESLGQVTPGIEVTGPGLAGFPTRGPSRFFGGDHALAEKVATLVGPTLKSMGPALIGIADGAFAARLAARSVKSYDTPTVVPPGDSPQFLAPLGIDELGIAPLANILKRLGLHTLGSFAALNRRDVVGRFGRDAMMAHRLASGEDEHPPDLRMPAPDLSSVWNFEPPAERVESCAFVAKLLADELYDALSRQGLSCVRVAIEAESESGETQTRLWRHEGAMSAAAMADRTRWQLDGWLRQTRGQVGGVSRLSLIPDEVIAATGRQLGFWGDDHHQAHDVSRSVSRLQALLGPEAVMVPELKGGLAPSERIRLVPAGAVNLAERRSQSAPPPVGSTQNTLPFEPSARSAVVETEPWPGRIPAPAPTQVHPDPIPIQLMDQAGNPLEVNARGEVSARPAVLVIVGHDNTPGQETGLAASRQSIARWAGPWPANQRWWDPLTHRRRARLQVTTDSGAAYLLAIEHHQWWLEATY